MISSRCTFFSDKDKLTRSKLASSTVDDSVLKQPIPSVQNGQSHNRILEILSEPVTINSTFNNLADELGQIVSKHALSLRVDDTSSPVVLSFK